MEHWRGKSSIKTESVFLLKVIFRDFQISREQLALRLQPSAETAELRLTVGE